MALPQLRVSYPLVLTLIFACCSTVAALNQGTCDALDSIDDDSTTLTCTTNSVCDKTTCISGTLSGFKLCLELLPCMDIPGYNTCTLARCALETWTW
ncbi:hypothetical protein GBAR_LOCUS8713 [Geodia barretti]|uniref:Uncharacterized protein n=1 Tax=Geodia barretti TaxID=519541 RepID=A0AA35WE12_GEOBA|nr:hypothetical protein GBAR_LOCUS8713 [Geodia barretti]